MKAPAVWLRRLCTGAILAIGLALLPAGASAGTITTYTGHTTEASGLVANYKIEVQSDLSNWNGTLVLYSHGYTPVLGAATDAGDPTTGAWLLSQGYALAGSAYATAGWSLESAFQDQMALLAEFDTKVGRHPDRTIAWGHSLGGMITAGLIQLFPERFTAALPMCGVLQGGPGTWNASLDSEFAFLTLQAPGAFKLVNFTASEAGTFSPLPQPGTELQNARNAFDAAQLTKAGRAHIALSAALGGVPGWFSSTSLEPAANEYLAQETNQFTWIRFVDLSFGFAGRYEIERQARAGGNYSWNTGVDYRYQLAHSASLAEVKALYEAAGLDLEQDLDTLNDTPRIAADPQAVAYMTKFITYNGNIEMPVLTMHTTGDGLVPVTGEQAYGSVVRSAGNSKLLRQVFVHRAGHCTFSPAETISAFQTLVHRINSGRWRNTTDPAAMNSLATALGRPYNVIYVTQPFPQPPAIVPVSASFFDFKPTQFLRPFDARNVSDDQGGSNNQN